MSMMICRECDRLKDTDFDLDGTWTDQNEWICTACTDLLMEYAEALEREAMERREE